MSDILRLFLVVILLTTGLAAYFLVAGALFRQRVAKTKAVINSVPGRSFGIGLVNFVFFTVIAIVLFSLAENTGAFIKGVLTIPAIIITAFLAIMLSFGLTGMAGLLGERIFPDLSAWKQTLWGTVCLSFACSLPFVGWFLLLPYAGFVGVGAFILGFFQREPKP
jgi:sorbitol-specific phosphotransferase system component IIBC